MTNREIALELELSEQTVKNQLSLGLKKLREELKNISVCFGCYFLLTNYSNQVRYKLLFVITKKNKLKDG